MAAVGTIAMAISLCAIGFFFGQASMLTCTTQLSVVDKELDDRKAEVKALREDVDRDLVDYYNGRLADSFLIEKISADQDAAEKLFGAGNVDIYDAEVVLTDEESSRTFRFFRTGISYPGAPWTLISVGFTDDSDH